MKTPSLHPLPLTVCAVLLGVAASLRADNIRIRIPNPIPRIVKHIERVGEKVGDIVIRTAERIEVEAADWSDEYERPPRPAPPPPLPPGTRRYIFTPEPPPPNLSYEDRYRYGLIYDSARTAAPPKPQPPPPSSPKMSLYPEPPPRLDLHDRRSGTTEYYEPSDANPSADASAPREHEPSYRPLPPSAAGTASSAGTTAAGAQSAEAAGAGKPAPPPKPAYGKNVPGRPGLVYAPGTKEIPENMIDVRGILPGTKVRDPATKIVFLVP